MKSFALFFILICFSLFFSHPVTAANPPDGKKVRVYIGTYTGPKSKGIYVSTLNLKSGELTSPELAAEVVNPTFLAIHPNKKFLYAANEIANYEGKKAGGVAAFSMDHVTGRLHLLNQESSVGAGPCHLVVDRTGKNVLVANYGGGSVCSLPIRQDGKVGAASAFIQHTGTVALPDRQQAPHAHSINVDLENRFAVAADLGLDKLFIYRFDADRGSLTPNAPAFGSVKPGSGPRHFAFHPKKPFAYVINEIVCTVTAFNFDPRSGALTEIQTISSLPPGEEVKRGYSTAEIQVHPSGKFVYGSNRGHDSIAVFAVDAKKGTLRHVENESTGGKTPRNFGIDPTGSYLLAANQNSDTVIVFRIDSKTGQLDPTGHSIQVGSPVCIKFVAY